MIFNKYDLLRDPIEIDPEADYYCITDDKELTSEVWNIIYNKEFDTDKLSGIQKTYRCKYQIYKYIPNVEKYDYIARVDASIQIFKSLEPIINYLNRGKYDLSVAPHPQRQYFIEEYNAWIQSRGMNPNCLTWFLTVTKDYDYTMPGLCENTFHVYHNCKEIFNLLDEVYMLMQEASPENELIDPNDQCFFTYVLFKSMDKIRINFHPATLYRYSDYMKVNLHNEIKFFHEQELPYIERVRFCKKLIHINNLNDYNKNFE